ncbi:MAG: hypothetical protein ACKE5M_02995 [Methylophilaceae bacterium]
MKQDIKKDSNTKASTHKTTNTTKADQAKKVDALHLDKTTLNSRFLEASCDCV